MYNIINMVLLSHLGIQAISAVAAVLIVQLVFTAFDNAINEVARSLVGQSTSKEKENFPASLEKIKNRIDHQKRELLLVQTISFNALMSTIMLGMLVGGLSIVFPVQVLRFFGTEVSVASYGATYFQIVGGCIALNFLVRVMRSTLQGLDETGICAKSGNFTHVVVGSLGVYLLSFGLVGVAWATVMAGTVEVIFLMPALYNRVFSKKVASFRAIWDVRST
jgi:Na+-driven multidrug efflux pump